MKLITKQRGLTLLEAILVLTIMSAILVLGLRFYKSWQQQVQIQQLQYNVSLLLQAMGQYYWANCATGLNPGSTSPFADITAASVAAGTAYPVSLTALQPFININSLVNNIPLLNNSNDTSTSKYTAYTLQFNPVLLTTETVGCANTATCTASTISSNTNILRWQAQVSVKINTPAGFTMSDMLKAYHNVLGSSCSGGLCAGTLSATGSVVPAAYDTGNYLFFTLTPSAATTNAVSRLWQTMPMINQFNLQYTHDQMYELMNNTLNTTTSPAAETIYYVCGG